MIDFRWKGVLASLLTAGSLNGKAVRKLTSLIVLLVFAVYAMPPVLARAQEISLTSPSTPSVLREGDDFARVVLGNPWDFNERRDIGWEELFSEQSINVTKGRWNAISSGSGAYLFPLFGGLPGALTAEAPDGDKTLPRFGSRHPVDTRIYKVLSFKISQTARSSLAVYWAKVGAVSTLPDGSNFGAIYDAYSNRGDVIYTFDLSNLQSSFAVSAGNWNGQVVSLRIDPSISSPAGSSTSLDWVRLVNPTSSPSIQVAWQHRSLPTNRIVKVYLDTDNSGYDGSQISFLPEGKDQGSVSISSATLPPGRYYFYVTAEYGSTTVRSNYSASITVNGAPEISFDAPNETSGEDYATTEVGNAWDMSNAGDIANLPQSGLAQNFRQFTAGSFENGKFTALADSPQRGAQETDAQVWPNVSKTRTIPSSHYRYLTYRISLDGTNFGNINDKVSKGWVTRAVYWNADLFKDGGSSRAHLTYEGYHAYTIDLWDSKTVESGLRWQDLAALAHLRIDPLETSTPTWFNIDWIKLTKENWSTGSQFLVRWQINDPDSQSLTVSLFYDTAPRISNVPSANGRFLTKLNNVRAGPGSAKVTLPNLPHGSSVYIYMTVTDGINQSTHYASVPVRVGALDAKAIRKLQPRDFDGDSIADPTVYRTAGFFVNASTRGASFYPIPSGSGRPLIMDQDGDGRADPTVVTDTGGYLLWNTLLSSSQTIVSRYWGLSNDIALTGDFFGSGRDAIAVFRPSLGQWYILGSDGSVISRQWGLPGDIPLATDFDGDRKCDLIVYRQSSGSWWLLANSSLQSPSPSFRTIQWGLPGDIPLVASSALDSEMKLVVFRPHLGQWFIRGLTTNVTEQAQWGLPGDIPITGDYNGDGLTDLTVWRPQNGFWFHNFRNGSLKISQWGLPGDRVP